MHAEVEEMLKTGTYHPGANPEHDLAVRVFPEIRRAFEQPVAQRSNSDEATDALNKLRGIIRRERETLAVGQRETSTGGGEADRQGHPTPDLVQPCRNQ
jgi:hypothetical protein